MQKPRFLSKAERQRLALEKRNAEANEQRLKEEQEKQSRIEFERAIDQERRRAEQERYGQCTSRQGLADVDERYNGRNLVQNQTRIPSGPRVPTGPRAQPSKPDAVPPSDIDMATIRARYLGQKDDSKKPRLRKEQNKKIVFDWKAEDDTSGQDLRNLIEQQPLALLGGSLAGYDIGRGTNGIPDK